MFIWRLVFVKSVKADFVVARVVNGWAHLPFLLEAEKVDSIAANFSRALGARPVGMIQCARGAASPFGFWY